MVVGVLSPPGNRIDIHDESDEMTARLTTEIRETELPVRCSACFNQQPQLRHVDFDAACDRGYGDDASVKVVMDDLILCENCVTEGARVLGIEDSNTLKAERDDARRKHEVERKRREKAERYTGNLEEAIGNRTHIDHRKKPRKPVEELAA